MVDLPSGKMKSEGTVVDADDENDRYGSKK
jgi:hypothetical protein